MCFAFILSINFWCANLRKFQEKVVESMVDFCGLQLRLLSCAAYYKQRNFFCLPQIRISFLYSSPTEPPPPWNSKMPHAVWLTDILWNHPLSLNLLMQFSSLTAVQPYHLDLNTHTPRCTCMAAYLEHMHYSRSQYSEVAKSQSNNIACTPKQMNKLKLLTHQRSVSTL